MFRFSNQLVKQKAIAQVSQPDSLMLRTHCSYHRVVSLTCETSEDNSLVTSAGWLDCTTILGPLTVIHISPDHPNGFEISAGICVSEKRADFFPINAKVVDFLRIGARRPCYETVDRTSRYQDVRDELLTARWSCTIDSDPSDVFLLVDVKSHLSSYGRHRTVNKWCWCASVHDFDTTDLLVQFCSVIKADGNVLDLLTIDHSCSAVSIAKAEVLRSEWATHLKSCQQIGCRSRRLKEFAYW